MIDICLYGYVKHNVMFWVYGMPTKNLMIYISL